MYEAKFWLVLIFLLELISCQQQIESPVNLRRNDGEPYLKPELRGGIGVVSDNNNNRNRDDYDQESDDEGPRRRYPDRSYSQRYDPGSAFRQNPPPQQQQVNPNSSPNRRRDPANPAFNYEPYPTRNVSSNQIVTRRTTTTTTTTARPGARTTRDPFNDPNRYKIPQTRQQHDEVRFVNGRPYREQANIQDRYGNRYDPRYHSIPGSYDPENDPRFSDPRYQDPRNVPKYNNNRHKVPQDRYDSKYRYYERFPDRQRDRIRDPNYDPRWDPDDPPVPGVLGGWLPELQGECRPGCENLPRDVDVNTNYGRVNGFLVYLYDGPRVPEFNRPGVANVDKIKQTVSVFLGIPYAQPPTGEARLMPPRPHRGWQSYDAVDWAPVCPQPIRYVGATKNAPHMDEDCLYLNVYTPTVDSGQSQLFPVMFYIHDGEFSHGSGNDFAGHQLAGNGQVVVVTINYRLGALGFLSTGDHHSPGNYGLLDMAMALKWVHDNVISFQGDRDRITVFGPGAGAASAGLLAIMPRSRSMVRRVIAMSGSPLADWAAINDKFRAMNTSLVFGERVGCTIDNSWKLVDCLRRGRSFAELTNVEFKPEIGTWPWAPVIQKNISVPDDEWYEEWTSDDFIALPELVSVAYENQQYNPKLQYLTGVARDDAAYMIYNNKSLAPNYNIGWDFFDTMVRDHIMQYNYTLNPEGIFGAIKYMYTYYPDPNNRSHIREEFINFYSDFFFRAPQDAIVKTLVRNRVDTYMYVQNTTVEALKLPWWRQITHNLEHYFLSGAPFMDPVFFPEDQQLSRRLWTEGDRNMSEFFIYAMANFSWYGNPTPKTILGVHWDMAKQGEILQYLAINTTENATTLWNYRQRECAFWTDYLPSVIGYITPTYPPTTEFWWEPDSPLQIAFWSMSSICLMLMVLVVICFLLWRHAKRQVTSDPYVGQLDSLRDYPPDYDGQHHQLMGMQPIDPYKADLSHTGRAASAMDPLMSGTLRSHMSQAPTVVMANNGSVLGTLPPQQPMVITSSASMNMIGPNGLPMGYPSQPLPPTPGQQHRQLLINPAGLPVIPVTTAASAAQMLNRNMSTDSIPSMHSMPQQQQLWQMTGAPVQQQQQQQMTSMQYKHMDSPHLSSSGRSSGHSTDTTKLLKRPGTPPAAAPPPAAPPAPLGVPKTHAKLVPGRMNTNNSQTSATRNVPSTAV